MLQSGGALKMRAWRVVGGYCYSRNVLSRKGRHEGAEEVSGGARGGSRGF